MRFSIIIPAFNAEDYLSEALRSLDLQTYRDFETIIVDDGSTDMTASLADSYANNRADVRVVHQQNKGLLLARRVGLKASKGQYIVFLDADDQLRPDALEIISNSIDDFDADIVSFRMSRKANYLSDSIKKFQLEAGSYGQERYEIAKLYICEGCLNNLCSKAIRRSVIDIDVDYMPYAGLMHGEDLLQLLPIVDASRSLTQLDSYLYYYRPSDGASTACFKASQLKDISRVCEVLLRFGKKWGTESYQAAKRGEILQYLSLVKMVALGDSPYKDKRELLKTIRSNMIQEGTIRRAQRISLRIDRRLLINSLNRCHYDIAMLLVKIVEVLKQA